MKFIHLGDSHLSSQTKFESSVSEFIRESLWKSFEKILNDNKDLDFALIGGDLYERNYFTLSDYMKLFDIIKSFGKNVYYVTGNHDFIDKDNEIFIRNKPDNLFIFSNDRINFYQEDKVRIYGISYYDRVFDKKIDLNIDLDHDYFNILLLHADINNISSPYLNLNKSDLSKLGFDYYALGHIHKPLMVSKNILYSGAIEPTDFSYEGDYGYIKYDGFLAKRIFESKLNFLSLEIDGDDFYTYEKFLSFIKSKLNDKINFLRIFVKNGEKLNLDGDKLKKDLGVFYLEIKIEESFSYESLEKTYPDSLLSSLLENSKELDNNDKLNKRAIDIAIDAVLRSRYD